MPARAISSASITFGLVAIPVQLYSTVETAHEVHFHRIHAGCGERVIQQYACPVHGAIERSAIARAYQHGRGTSVELSEQEQETLEETATGAITIAEFVPAATVDPIYVDRTYYLGPGRGGARPYRLLRDALADAGLVGIASYAARGRGHVVALRPFDTGLAMHQLHYADQLRPWSAIHLPALPAPSPQELELARQLVAQLAHPSFDPDAYHDTARQRAVALLERKAERGEGVVAAPAAAPATVPDLMAALRASLEQSGKAAPHERKHARKRHG